MAVTADELAALSSAVVGGVKAAMGEFNQRIGDTAIIATIQTTQVDHERRLTTIEGNYGKLLFWSMSAALMSFGSIVAFMGTVVTFLLTRPHP